MQKRPRIFPTFLFLGGIVSLQIVYLVAVFATQSSVSIDYINYAYSTVMYLIVSVLICVEIKRLEEFNIDKFTIITLILFSFLRRRLVIVGEGYFLILIGLAGISMIVALITNKPKLLRTNLRWTLFGIMIGGITLFPIAQLELFLRHTWLANPLLRNNLALTAISDLLKQLSFTSLPEEILFRGFIWGYLRREGWEENKIIWIQGVLFWLIHIGRLATPFTFFFAIPILTLISSQLTKRSKQVFPAILSHTIINSVSAILNLATF